MDNNCSIESLVSTISGHLIVKLIKSARSVSSQMIMHQLYWTKNCLWPINWFCSGRITSLVISNSLSSVVRSLTDQDCKKCIEALWYWTKMLWNQIGHHISYCKSYVQIISNRDAAVKRKIIPPQTNIFIPVNSCSYLRNIIKLPNQKNKLLTYKEKK